MPTREEVAPCALHNQAFGELRRLSSGSASDRPRYYPDCLGIVGARAWDLKTALPMLFKLFRKPSDVRPRVERDSSLAEELARRVNSIEFQPSRGFLKDQRQPKRSAYLAAASNSRSHASISGAADSIESSCPTAPTSIATTSTPRPRIEREAANASSGTTSRSWDP